MKTIQVRGEGAVRVRPMVTADFWNQIRLFQLTPTGFRPIFREDPRFRIDVFVLPGRNASTYRLFTRDLTKKARSIGYEKAR